MRILLRGIPKRPRCSPRVPDGESIPLQSLLPPIKSRGLVRSPTPIFQPMSIFRRLGTSAPYWLPSKLPRIFLPQASSFPSRYSSLRRCVPPSGLDLPLPIFSGFPTSLTSAIRAVFQACAGCQVMCPCPALILSKTFFQVWNFFYLWPRPVFPIQVMLPSRRIPFCKLF